MRSPFKKLSLDQFAELLARYPFTRSVNAVHMHHTWRPNHQQFKGEESIIGMWKYHTEHNGWSDIAQHITIGPEGDIWLGRDWNTPPASAKGYNGDYHAGPFMFEMIGDFDVGGDKFDGKQRATAIAVVAVVQQCFDLPATSLRFHSMMSGKTCPGISIDYQATLDDVRRQRRMLDDQRRALPDTAAPFHRDSLETSVDIGRTLDGMKSEARQVMSASAMDADACAHHHHRHDDAPVAGRAREAKAPVPVPTQGQQTDLRPHLVNLSMGELSSSGEWTTTRADVDAIFQEFLPRALEAAVAAGKPLRLMFQAHGGLDDEATGLAIARKSVAWWLANGIYPIYFAWETGLFESIGQLLRRAVSGKRDLADYTSDPLIQETLRLLGAPKIWGVMKQNAQVASSPDTLGNSRQIHAGREGGAYYVAQQLAAFCKRHGDDVELHALGHSAGSIFHSWFIPCALGLGVREFHSLQLMAPAVRVDLFKENLAPLLGDRSGVKELTVYTMKDANEEDDSCAGIYRKSLLCLIFHALEPQRKTPILGLEDTLRADPELSRMFGLTGGPARAEIIWSPTEPVNGRSASKATSHGGFDDDPSTMGSIARRVLNKEDHESIVEYPSTGNADRGIASAESAVGIAVPTPPARNTPLARPSSEIRIGEKRGARRALCVGINQYAARPLAGCVADVDSWSRALSGVGFTVSRLLDQDATRASIIEHLERMIAESHKGDVIVFQYSGHGTQVPDLNGDDADGTDEAIVPYDYQSGAFLLDDDLGQIYARLPEGVNLSCFMDCCHSGDNARLFFDGGDERQRFLPVTDEMTEAHRRYRQNLVGATAGARAFAPGLDAKPTFESNFAACSPTESAWESGGQGEFTVRATAVLKDGIDNLTNAAFLERVRASFAEPARQHVQLDSSHRGAAKNLFLQALAAPPAAKTARADIDTGADLGRFVEVLQRIEELLQRGQAQLDWPNGNGLANGGLHLAAPGSVQRDEQQNR